MSIFVCEDYSPHHLTGFHVFFHHRLVWEYEIEKTLNSRRGPGSRYVLLRSDQLVGAALMVYAKENVVAQVRNVECAIKKVCFKPNDVAKLKEMEWREMRTDWFIICATTLTDGYERHGW